MSILNDVKKLEDIRDFLLEEFEENQESLRGSFLEAAAMAQAFATVVQSIHNLRSARSYQTSYARRLTGDQVTVPYRPPEQT